jgi:hypothetical protein
MCSTIFLYWKQRFAMFFTVTLWILLANFSSQLALLYILCLLDINVFYCCGYGDGHLVELIEVNGSWWSDFRWWRFIGIYWLLCVCCLLGEYRSSSVVVKLSWAAAHNESKPLLIPCTQYGSWHPQNNLVARKCAAAHRLDITDLVSKIRTFFTNSIKI